MSPRIAPFVLASSLAVLLAACAAGGAAPSAPAGAPASTASADHTPLPTLPLTASTAPRPTAASHASPTPDSGNVDAPQYPALSVEPVSALTIRVTLADPAAKAWRLTVAGTGATADDRWTLQVETGDVMPMITTTETLHGVAGDPIEQPGLEAGGGPSRICSLDVPVCVKSASVVLPADGNGTLVLELTRTDTSADLAVTGGTASWPTEPFVLGPWTTTEAFPWSS